MFSYGCCQVKCVEACIEFVELRSLWSCRVGEVEAEWVDPSSAEALTHWLNWMHWKATVCQCLHKNSVIQWFKKACNGWWAPVAVVKFVTSLLAHIKSTLYTKADCYLPRGNWYLPRGTAIIPSFIPFLPYFLRTARVDRHYTGVAIISYQDRANIYQGSSHNTPG